MQDDDDDPVARATALLSTLLHCRQHALALRACQRGLPAAPSGCERESAAFVTCSNEHLPQVIGHLIKIADVHCQDYIQSVRRCRTTRPGSDCEEEDLAVMRCASLKVLTSAAAPPT